MRADTRSRISAAALFVNVTARMDDGDTLRTCNKYAMRYVNTRVLPLPAPAMMSKRSVNVFDRGPLSII